MSAAPKISDEFVAQNAAVILLTRDGGKARASWFPAPLSAHAKRAASLMQVNYLQIANDEVRQLATKLPQGRIFDSGKAFMPLVQGKIADALAVHLPKSKPPLRVVASSDTPKSPAEGAKGNSVVGVRHHPKDWTDIKVGSLVLACEVEKEGWYECVVQAIRDGQLVLRWLDYPEYESFMRPPERVGLLWAASTVGEKA